MSIGPMIPVPQARLNWTEADELDGECANFGQPIIHAHHREKGKKREKGRGSI
jgi:hypothetical protein